MHDKDISEKINEIFSSIPHIDFHHVQQLTNSFGILQHAKFNIPNYHHGYCLDDNCRALLLISKSITQSPSPQQRTSLNTYLSFIYYMQQEDGSFINFISIDYKFPESIGSPDSFGRTMWALGVLLENKHASEFHPIAKEIFDRAFSQITQLKSLRAVAYTILGLRAFVQIYPENDKIARLKELANYMVQQYQGAKTEKWHWFEEIIAYDNAILPLALLDASVYFDSEQMKTIALQAFDFLDDVLFKKQHLSIIGNEEWFQKNKLISEYGQQPIEVYSIILLYQQVFKDTGLQNYRDKKNRAFLWFFGMNDKALQVYDPLTKGCCDGLEKYGVNRNQGAESTLCFWLSYLEIYAAEFLDS